MKNSILYLITLFMLAISCGGSKYDSAMTEAKYSMDKLDEESLNGNYDFSGGERMKKSSPQATINQQEPEEPQQIEQKLIKTGYLTLQVEDYKEARTKTLAAVKLAKGYISQDNEENSSYRTGTSMVIRVQKQNFDTLVNTLVSFAKLVERKNISLKDVTEEFVDIQARLKNKREVEKRYVEILQKAKTIKDILEVEEHLRQLREEIEAKEGRLKYLQSQVSYSTIHLELYQQYTQSSYKPSFFGQMGKAIVGGWDGLQTFIIGLVYIWPFLLIFALLIWLARRWMLRRKQNKA